MHFSLKILINLIIFLVSLVFFILIFFFSFSSGTTTKQINIGEKLIVISKLTLVDIGRYSNKIYLLESNDFLSPFDKPFVILNDPAPKIIFNKNRHLRIILKEGTDIEQYKNYQYINDGKYQIDLEWSYNK